MRGALSQPESDSDSDDEIPVADPPGNVVHVRLSDAAEARAESLN